MQIIISVLLSVVFINFNLSSMQKEAIEKNNLIRLDSIVIASGDSRINNVNIQEQMQAKIKEHLYDTKTNLILMLCMLALGHGAAGIYSIVSDKSYVSGPATYMVTLASAMSLVLEIYNLLRFRSSIFYIQYNPMWLNPKNFEIFLKQFGGLSLLSIYTLIYAGLLTNAIVNNI